MITLAYCLEFPCREGKLKWSLAVSLSWGQNSGFKESKPVRICREKYGREDFIESWGDLQIVGSPLSLQLSNHQNMCMIKSKAGKGTTLERSRRTNPSGTRLGIFPVLLSRGEKPLYTWAKNWVLKRVMTQYWGQVNFWLKIILDLPKNT